MNTGPSIRESVPDDCDAIEAMYPEAFPDEDLVPLVRDLLKDPANVLSLVATIDSRIAGHVAFTRCGVSGHDVSTAMLAPLAVTPTRQRQGIGSALVRAGLQNLQVSGVALVCVLGDPAYYGRHGFTPDSSIDPPYPLPPEWKDAWQSLRLGTSVAITGKLLVPDVWMKPALWLP